MHRNRWLQEGQVREVKGPRSRGEGSGIEQAERLDVCEEG